MVGYYIGRQALAIETWKKQDFPMKLAYCIPIYKCEGQTLDERTLFGRTSFHSRTVHTGVFYFLETNCFQNIVACISTK